ncbi:hypothetical protein DERF_016687 [Dermatophagoides farinae]|uniref:Uncharacterized protein n=1 Tax=Dermatophagoides farinae TaxID=6954 RepID=A0A922KRB3_DERFA|nr:hypothetical protein DERF_016687 [Dermatophagoides farinae]
MSTDLMNSPSIRRSNSYRIALRKSGVPKELLENNDYQSNADNNDYQSNADNNESQQQTQSTTSASISKERLFKKRKQQGINPIFSSSKISSRDSNEKEMILMAINGDNDGGNAYYKQKSHDDDENDEDSNDETLTLKPLSLDTEFETQIDNVQRESIVQNGQHSKIKNDQIIEKNINDEQNIYSKCKHLFCLFCCCNYCCCLLRDYFS